MAIGSVVVEEIHLDVSIAWPIPHPYRRDLPNAEFHLIDTGHFALEDKADEIIPLIRDFLDRKVAL